MKILLLGKHGQLATELASTMVGIGTLICLDRTQADFTRPEDLANTVLTIKPELIINAAAYTQVDKAEKNSALAHLINAEAVKCLAQCAKKLNVWLIHFSTDYVFDGLKKTPYTENDFASPLSQYGKSKLLGEQYIQQECDKYLIFRTSWLFSNLPNNFVKTIIAKTKSVTTLTVVEDQIGAPTSANLVAQVVQKCILFLLNNSRNDEENMALAGIYHLTSNGSVSWHALAQHIIDFAEQNQQSLLLNSKDIVPITSENYGAAAKRPKNSQLNTNKLKQTFSLQLPHWSQLINEMLLTEFSREHHDNT